MEGPVGATDTNCDSDKHVGCSHVRCSRCCATGEKHHAQPPIDEKHKQKNQEILERKQKLSNPGRKMSRKVSELESHQLGAKLAFERQQQKKVEVYDSHAIDFTQLRDADDQSDIFLPRHLKKRQSSQSLISKVQVENNAGNRQTAVDEEQSEIESTDALEVLRNVEDLRRASLAYGIIGPQRNSPQHDTLRAYFKFRKDNMAKEDRLKRVQAKARLRDVEDEATSSPSIIRKPITSRTVLPPLNKLSSGIKLGTRTNAKEINRVHYKEKPNRGERHGKLPKISRKNLSKVRDTGRDPRFQKLISCLVPLSEKSPPFTRKRHYTT